MKLVEICFSMDCNCAFKCVANCGCPHKTKSSVILEDMLMDMLSLSGLSPTKKSKEVSKNEFGCDRNYKGFDINFRPENETILEQVTPPDDFYYNFEDSPKKEIKSKPKASCDMFKKRGLQRSTNTISNIEEHRAATKNYNPEKVSKMIDENIQKISDMQKKLYKKSNKPSNEVYEESWTDFLRATDFTSQTKTNAVKELIEQWQTAPKKNRRNNLPPHCDPMLGRSYYESETNKCSKVYPPRRYKQ